MEEIINLVDGSGTRIGQMEKMDVHRTGALHEAFSIFIVDENGHMILQKRAQGKYHSGGLWSNACCGHPRAGENVRVAAHRRLREEMDFDCELREVTPLLYHAQFENGLIEYEFDHIFIGQYDGEPIPDPQEVDDWQHAPIPLLIEDVRNHPEGYACWFREALPQVIQELEWERIREMSRDDE